MLAVSYAGGGPIGAAWLTERKGEELWGRECFAFLVHAGISNPLKTVGNLQHGAVEISGRSFVRKKLQKCLGCFVAGGASREKVLGKLPATSANTSFCDRGCEAVAAKLWSWEGLLLLSESRVWPGHVCCFFLLGLRCQDGSPGLIPVRTSALLLQVCWEGQAPDSCTRFWAGTLQGSKAEDAREARPLTYFKRNSVFEESDLQ